MGVQTARCFPHVSDLKSISPKRLVQVLSPYRKFLLSRGLDLSMIDVTMTTPDHATLMRLLMTFDSDMPVELVNSLHCIHEVSAAGAMDSLLEEAAGLGIPLDDPDLSPADIAVLIWLRDHRVLERIHAEQFAVRSFTFVYFQGNRSEDVTFTEPSPAIMMELEQDLNYWFEHMQQGRTCRVYVYHRDDGIWFVVWHGDHYRREGCIERGESSCICYRPERYDILVYQPATDELQIGAGTRSEREIYRKLFGRYLFGDDNHFPGTAKYTLDPLRTDGQRALVCSDVPGMEYVKLYRVECCIDGPLRSIETVEAEDVFAAINTNDVVISPRVRLSEAWFRIKFAGSRTPRVVSLRPSNMIHFQQEDDRIMVDLWLRLRGFMLGNQILPLLLICHILFGFDAFSGFGINDLCLSCGIA